jgi:outer membrane protein TolC
LNQVTANLAQRSSNRIAAEQQVLAAQQQLMLDMGLSAEQISQERLLPADDFPNGEDQPLPSDSAISMQYYVDQALLHRSDYLASRQRVAEQGILVNAARNRLLPQIDLNLYSGYSGWREGVSSGNFFTSSGTGIGGPNSGIGIKYSFATKNQAFHGALRQAQAISRQVDLQSSDTARNISASVVIAVNAVRHAILRVKKARESVVAFQAALSGQRDRYKGGISSLVEALSVEDKLNAALSDQVQAELSYAVALTQFRFATGTITGPPGLTQNIPVGNFLTMPYMGAPEERP